MEPWKDSCCSSDRYQRSLAIRIKNGCEDRSNCVLKHCLALTPNFETFFTLLGTAFSCIRKMPSLVTSAKREFTPAIVSLSASREVDIEQFFTEVEVNRTRIFTEPRIQRGEYIGLFTDTEVRLITLAYTNQ